MQQPIHTKYIKTPTFKPKKRDYTALPQKPPTKELPNLAPHTTNFPTL